ncbi:MarC family protein [Conchiformibius steedae]|uniref:MarC family protein n=1 Tax=Conchiformibius steedae TaxID=153493 RepID=UPI0016399849|nr:MarC family protein [Conchiformibius steedae]
MSLELEIAKIFLALVVLVNPFSALPIFLDLTHNYSKRERTRAAQIASLSVFVTIAVFALVGGGLLSLLGISTGAFRVGGGILVFLIAISMMSSGNNPAKPDIGTDDASEITIARQPAVNIGAIAVVPLAIPMMIGPGGISTVVIYTATAKSYWDIAAVIIAGGVIALLCYLTLLAATKVSDILGETGLTVLNRVMGMLLAAVSVEIIVAGLRELFPQLG